jgi:nitrogenase molybdenum-iron protein alpha chain
MGIVVDKETAVKIIEDILSAYPTKAKKDRAKHMTAVAPGDTKCAPKSNIKTRPGVMTVRGCAYAGSKGVVWGPVKDMIHISHGPVGCGYYSRAGRRNYYIGTTGVDTFVTPHFTTDFQERDIVFGGDKKLTQAIKELEALFPLNRGITIQSECPIGLIGDDIEAVARNTSKEIGKPVVPVRCEGFRGVSQSLGHHIANDSMRDWVYEKGVKGQEIESSPYDVAIWGDYNIGGDAWATRKIIEKMGLRVITQWSGDGTLSEIANATKVKMLLVHCYRSSNYLARYFEEKFGIPWMEYNFFGPTQIFESMRKIASMFDDKIKERTEELIEKEYKPRLDRVIEKYRPRLEGKTVVLYVGGLRPRHIITAFEDLGMHVVATGYEFAHQDDYDRTLHYIDKNATIIVDDATAHELEELLRELKPDLMASGIKEKYQAQKMGVPFRQMHSWDYSGPYHGIEGFEIFARDVDMAVNGNVWKMMKAPWQAA